MGRLRTRKILNEPLPDLIAHPTEFRQQILFRALQSRGVVKSPVNPLNATEEEGAFLIGVAAKRNHIIKRIACKFVNCFGTLTGAVNTQFCQDPAGQGIDPRGFGAGGKCLEVAGQIMIGKPFGHLGAA